VTFSVFRIIEVENMPLSHRTRPLPASRYTAWFIIIALSAASSRAGAQDYHGDVTDVSVVRRVEQQPGSALLWEPYIAEWRPKHLIVAFGAGIPGKTDMGDILACVSTDDGKT
jgi:hypothetical protein